MTSPAQKLLLKAARWRCGARNCSCGSDQAIPMLPDATVGDLRAAIARAHERRSRDCHEQRGTRQVSVVFPNGVRLSFKQLTVFSGASPALHPQTEAPLDNANTSPEPQPVNSMAVIPDQPVPHLPIPDSVHGDVARTLYAACQLNRIALKRLADALIQSRRAASSGAEWGVSGEVAANMTLCYRHVEDASMRLGKAMQHLDGGVSVYDRATTVGA